MRYIYLIGQCRSDFGTSGGIFAERAFRVLHSQQVTNTISLGEHIYLYYYPQPPTLFLIFQVFHTLLRACQSIHCCHPTFSSQGNYQSPESPPLQRPSSVFQHGDHSSQTPCPPQASSNCKLVRLTRPGGHKTNLTKTPKSLHFPLPAHLPLLHDHRPNHRLLSHRSRTGPAALAVIVQSVSMDHFLQ